jgi:hypothetical protein
MDDLSIHELVGSFPIVSRFLDSAEKTFSPGGTSSAGKDATDIPIILVRFSALWSGIVCHIRNRLAAPSLLWDNKITNIASDLSIDSHVSTAPRFFA